MKKKLKRTPKRGKIGNVTIPINEYKTLLKYKQKYQNVLLEERQRIYDDASINQQIVEINSIISQQIKESRYFPNVRTQLIAAKSALTK